MKSYGVCTEIQVAYIVKGFPFAVTSYALTSQYYLSKQPDGRPVRAVIYYSP